MSCWAGSVRRPMPDRLMIHELAAMCRLGIYEWEQEKPQAVTIDLELDINAARPAKDDDVRQAVDYARLVHSVKQLAEGRPYRLMETLAEDVAARVLGEFGVRRVVVRVTKRALPAIGYAAVEIQRRAGPKARRLRRSGQFPKVAHA